MRSNRSWMPLVLSLVFIFGISKSSSKATDSRLASLVDLNGYFPFSPPSTTEAWAERKSQLIDQLEVALGLWPRPTMAPLTPEYGQKVVFEDYTVQAVRIQSLPGFYVTGSLYRPRNLQSPAPGILCPHGHWSNGRFYDAGEKEVRNQIASGAERYLEGGRSHMQSRCVQLARMGCFVFHYDMIGYADSIQISYELAHRFEKQRPELNTLSNWGLFSPQAEANLQSVMGLQTINSIRALDFLESLDQVDPERLGVTGASGGGTQTFLLSAIDERVDLSFPAVMVSTAMQGGCTCENTSLLRVGTGNVEFAALFAPKPQGLTAADDWTREMERKGFPELQRLYELLGHKQNISLTPLTHFGHNYNGVSRTAMYNWCNQHFNLGWDQPVLEKPYRRLLPEEMTVWNKDDQPEKGKAFEVALLREWKADSDRALLRASNSKQRFNSVAQKAWRTILGRTFADAGNVTWHLESKEDRGNHLEMTGLITNQTYQEDIQALFLYPKEWKGETTVWISPHGKTGIRELGGNLHHEVQERLSKGHAIASIDLFMQVDGRDSNQPKPKNRKVSNNREFAGYSYGYNLPLFAQRTHDLLSLIKLIVEDKHPSSQIHLIGLEGAGHWVAAASAISGNTVSSVTADSRGFRFRKLTDYLHPGFLPGAAKYAGLAGMLASSDCPQITLDRELKEELERLLARWPEKPSIKSLEERN